MVFNTVDVEIFVPFNMNHVPFAIVWDLLIEAGEEIRIENDYSLLWVRSATPDDRYNWARGVSSYGVLDDNLIIDS